MENLNREKKAKSLYYFILITAVPIVGIAIIFSFAFFHTKKDVMFVSHEIRGLKVIKNIQKTVFNIQKMRGLVCIDNPNERSLENIETLKKEISKDLASVRKSLVPILGDTPLKGELINFIDAIEKSSLENSDFEHMTNIINKFMSFSRRMSYHCKLILEPDQRSFVLVDNIVYLLPELIEYNGQIRAMATSVKDKTPTYIQKQRIATQLEKIQERMDKLEYNLSLMYAFNDNSEVKLSYKKMLEAQANIIDFAKNELLKNKNTTIEPNGIFMSITDNINLIIDLYGVNLNIMSDLLDKNLQKYDRLLVLILLFSLSSVLFIIYINRVFYCKNREFINKIEELTVTDGMTNLYNRRYFDKIFENSLRVQQRTDETLIFIILDIDFFKNYNDTYGHQSGDEAIKTVAKNLKDALRRAGDMAFRLGGEEFGILCIGMSEAEAQSFANKIREDIEQEKIEHKKSKASSYLTVSMGLVVVKPKSIKNTEDIYRYADEALYKAKDNGRNRVVIYDISKNVDAA